MRWQRTKFRWLWQNLLCFRQKKSGSFRFRSKNSVGEPPNPKELLLRTLLNYSLNYSLYFSLRGLRSNQTVQREKTIQYDIKPTKDASSNIWLGNNSFMLPCISSFSSLHPEVIFDPHSIHIRSTVPWADEVCSHPSCQFPSSSRASVLLLVRQNHQLMG